MVIRSGINTLSQPIQWDTGAAFTAAAYEVGRDADGTNQLHFNVPTSASFEFSINDTARLVYSAGALAFQEQTTISTTSGNLVLNPSDAINVSGNAVLNAEKYTGRDDQALVISANTTEFDPTARRVNIDTIDPTGDAFVVVAYAEPTATETTPFWAQRADITTPLAGTLDANFLTFKWNPADDSVTVFVNDGGTIRSVAIGTVV